MLNRLLTQPWLRHVAVAVLYTVGYTLFRAVSFLNGPGFQCQRQC